MFHAEILTRIIISCLIASNEEKWGKWVSWSGGNEKITIITAAHYSGVSKTLTIEHVDWRKW